MKTKPFFHQVAIRFLILGALSIIITPGILYWIGYTENRSALCDGARDLAEILAADVRYSLLASSKEAAADVLVAFSRLPDVTRIAVYEEDGALLAQTGSVHGDSAQRHITVSETVLADVTIDPFVTTEGGSRKSTVIGRVEVEMSVARIEKNSTRIAVQSAIGSLALTLLLAVSMQVLSMRLFRPLSSLADFLESGESIDMNAELPYSGEERLSEASVIYKAVGNMRDRQRKFTDTLEQQVQERTQALVEARDQAIRANNAKTIFLANVSHELRTPLQAITALAECDASETLGCEVGIRQGILSASRQLMELIDQLLLLSRADAGAAVRCTPTRMAIDVVIKEVIQTLSPTLSPGNRLEFTQVGDGDTLMWADPVCIRRIIYNLVRNADRYMRNGCILLRLDLTESDWVSVSVIDEGVGIDTDDIERIFHAFYQADQRNGAAETVNVGLGLWLSRQVAEALDGELIAKRAVPRGSEFTLRLPRCQGEVDTETKPAQATRDAHQERSRFPGARVLLAEDEDIIRGALDLVLRRAGFAVDAAMDGEEAIHLIAAEPRHYDALVVDYWMPRANGMEVLDAWVAHGNAPARALLLTADETSELRTRLLATGACITVKPVRMGEFVSQVDSLVSHATAHGEQSEGR